VIYLFLALSFLNLIALIAVALLAEKRGQSVGEVIMGIRQAWAAAIAQHPKLTQAWLVTLAWLATLLPLLNHLGDPQHSLMGVLVWAWTIIPHEAGHLICSPLGWFVMVAGGSVWQVLFWLLLSVFVLKVRKQIAAACLFGMIAGHSFINLSVYIRDAQERDLQLIFGMDKSRHDWWNLLGHLGLLQYDNVLADISIIIGVTVVLLMIGAGIWAVWFRVPQSSAIT
jgi:hypothetical protein